jgi:RES domain-containing protein
MRNRVFISYSHKDSKWLKRLQVFLEPYEREGVLERWDDTRIDPGGKWREKIKEAIESASVAVLLISADFLASDFISENELPPILSAAEDKGLVILPVIISPSRFERTPGLSQFQTINPPSDPLIKMSKWKREDLLDKIAQAVETAISRTDATNVLAPTSEGPAKNRRASSPTKKVKEEDRVASLKAQKSHLSPTQTKSVISDDRFEQDDLYKFDRTKRRSDAAIRNGNLLYRLTSKIHSSREFILNGDGGVLGYREGRFNRVGQRAAYCADNILVSISEVLFNMYSQLVNRIEEEQPLRLIAAGLQSEMHLVVFRVREITDLVYSEADDARLMYDARLAKTSLIRPDTDPESLRRFSDQVRKQNKIGVICPSARHVRGHVLVFFRDESSSVRDDSYVKLRIKLQLIAEDQDLSSHPELFNPFEQAVHPTMGYYSFIDKSQFETLCGFGSINPKDAPICGFVDFIRRSYRNYPYDAVHMPRPRQA